MHIVLNLATIYVITNIITDQAIFQPIRDWLELRAPRSKIYDFLSDLFSCFFCMSCWVSVAFVIAFLQCIDIRQICLYVLLVNVIHKLMYL